MHAIELAGPGLENLRRATFETPSEPRGGQILVKMKATSLNFLDLAVALGRYPAAVYPNVPGVDGAGEVIAIGPEVWQVAIGDRVAVNFKPRWISGDGSAPVVSRGRGVNERGAMVEVLELDAASVVKVSDHLTWEAAATLPVAAMTAWKALEAASAGPGSTVVLLGTGGLSIFGLQLAKARGARVFITSSSDEKLERAKSLGADVTINYRENTLWDTVVRENTHGLGADLVIESVGGADFGRSVAAVRYGGLVFTAGFLAGTSAQIDLLSIIANGVRIEGANGGSTADLAAAAKAIASHRIEPVIDQTFGLTEIMDAYQLMGRGGHFGKIAVRLDW